MEDRSLLAVTRASMDDIQRNLKKHDKALFLPESFLYRDKILFLCDLLQADMEAMKQVFTPSSDEVRISATGE